VTLLSRGLIEAWGFSWSIKLAVALPGSIQKDLSVILKRVEVCSISGSVEQGEARYDRLYPGTVTVIGCCFIFIHPITSLKFESGVGKASVEASIRRSHLPGLNPTA